MNDLLKARKGINDGNAGEGAVGTIGEFTASHETRQSFNSKEENENDNTS